MKRSRKAICRTNKKLAVLSTQYDIQNMQLEAAESIQMFHCSDGSRQDNTPPPLPMEEFVTESDVVDHCATHNISIDNMLQEISEGGIQNNDYDLNGNVDEDVESEDNVTMIPVENSSDEDSRDLAEDSTTAHVCNNHNNVNECLRDWAIVHNEPRSSVNEILAIFRKWTEFIVPKDSRTLLKTPTTIRYQIQTVAGGEFWYKGIYTNLKHLFKSNTPLVDEISIHLFMDGIPLHKGGPTQLWPILMRVVELPLAPIMMIAVFCGSSKPSCLEAYLRQLVEEANELISAGLQIGGKTLGFKVKAIIADLPARAFVKATTNFNGYHGCMRCTCVGEWHRAGKKIIFDAVGAPLRTDEGFRRRECPGHHQVWRSPLEDLNKFDMVNDVPTERMHLSDLGVTRRHLCCLVGGKFKTIPNLSPTDKAAISKFFLKVQFPSEIHRKLRGLNVLRYWKASEFRSYLHYVSPIIMEEFLGKKPYCHYLLYFCGITMFSSAFHKHHWKRASDFLNSFVRDYGEIYGREHLTNNVHNLQHIAHDVNENGPIDDNSAYDFESFLQTLKLSARILNVKQPSFISEVRVDSHLQTSEIRGFHKRPGVIQLSP
ncbi:uncharacterized protein LOC121591344 [Anopheles merus]|uniref:uncharacterized protein LOC121591344 n=1 Tax=Anopheles merus TaxID=30066 RepID=UPI001BE44839|nr:uncharacterized protein LOC121591344 [Anopheles merus]